MRFAALRGVSAIGILFGLAGGAYAQTPQSAGDGVDRIGPQQQQQQAEEEELERSGARITITGSNIVGAVESAALPVDVFTAEESLQQGNQTPLEFIKSLPLVGSTVGETNQFQAGYASIGASTLNLRGLGGGRTLTIFNGRRFSENTNMIPSIALERTEILKDGGAVVYGADATGGVVNFITRDSFDGVIVDGEYKFVEGSDGDYNLGLLWGKEFESSNLMVSLEWNHRSELDAIERDWTIQPFSRNNTPWAPYHTYGSYLLRSPTGSTLGLVQDFTADECRTSTGPVEGQNRTISGLPVCWWNYMIHTYNLVEELDQYRLYGQYTADLSDNLRLTAQISYGKSLAPDIGTVAAYQTNVGPAAATGTAFQYRVPRSNPYFNSFLQQNASQINPAVLPLIAAADQFLTIIWGPGGVPHSGTGGQGSHPRTELENWNAVIALDGDFDGIAGDWLSTWKLDGVFNYATTDSTLPDTIGYRVQQALNGFGGPNCNAPDLVPDRFDLAGLDANNNGWVSPEEFYAVVGTQNPGAAGRNGCLWLNPFSSNYAANQTFGTPNPRYIQGNENSAELTRWLFDERQTENTNTNLTIDALVSGGSPIQLPGGMVAWAAGAQWRQAEGRESTSSEFIEPSRFPCAWPGQRVGDAFPINAARTQIGGCPAEQPPYWFFGSDAQTKSDQQQYSYFGEMQIPVLDNLSFQLAARREEFPRGGLGATVYKVAGKWDPFSWLAVRGSFGTNYATPPNNIVPGNVSTGLSLIAAAGNKYLRVSTVTLDGIQPETAEVGNFGLIFNFDQGLPLDGAFRLSLDYFDFTIKDEIKTVSHNQILNTVFADGQPRTAAGRINCSAPLIGRITFLNGIGAAGCTQGVTVGDDVTSVASVFGNGPGAKTSGVDIDASYRFGALGGDLAFGLNATNVLAYEIQAFLLNGVQLTPAVDGLGFANYSRDGDVSSEWRGNTYVNYNSGNHNLRYVLRYIQGVTDDRFIGTANERIDDFTTHNLYYQYTLPWDEDFTLSLSIDNVTDEDPPFTVQQYSYDPFIGNPLGRTFEVGVRKRF
ncbi:TonB-dependent receptor plug domain-containing protein [bacterium]|nr:TonB-dependent receptor plug domain-containing protein [bacterium]